MELSPKQQTVEQIKKAKKILILGHQKPEGDFLGAALALETALKNLEKTVEVVISDSLPEIYSFLPNTKNLKNEIEMVEGKILRIDTEKYPVSGMKYQKNDKHLDIILESDKNLKFQFVEIINGIPKPDLIIVLDTADVEKIDSAYDKNTELFFEVPVINIDHHAGNEYFGSVNLVDLTATSTCEILVSLFEALGVKIADPDTATCLLTGIIADTQSFRSPSTTPKSLTVAAQLLAAGGRQQEIITHLYKKRPMALLKLWGEMLAGISLDKTHRFAWTKVQMSELEGTGITATDVFDAADELLSNTPDADTILILCEVAKGKVKGKIKGAKETNILPLAQLFDGDGVATNANFEVNGTDLANIEMNILKRIHDYWGDKGQNPTTEVWQVIEKKEVEVEPPKGLSAAMTTEEVQEAETPKEDLSVPETKEEIEETTVTETENPEFFKDVVKTETQADPIENALKSIEKEQNEVGGFTPIGEVIKKKKDYVKDEPLDSTKDEEIDVFDEEAE
jgi:phosphoesterase RecJ-like protein